MLHQRLPLIARRFRAASACSLAACLLLSAGARSAEVYIQLDTGEVSDPSFVASSGPGYNGEVDLQNGTVKALVSEVTLPGSWLVGHTLTAGVDALELVNTGAAPITASSGFLTVALDGAFTFSTAGSGGRQAAVFVNAFLEASVRPAQGGSAEFYSAGIGTGQGWSDWQGFFTDYTEVSQENGATATIVQNDSTGLQAQLSMPAITLNPNDTLRIALSLFTGVNASNGAAATNDFFNTATLSLSLPPGSTITSNAGVPLSWISTTVPAPPAAWLLASGLVGLLRYSRRRATP
ncbi:MAG: hypothetical protein IT486_01290 [Gammaproteobacteria bacterium]|nr:hypothetical protein [Gammaproteobacteria bacterium]